MFYALVYYPPLKDEHMAAFRRKYDPYIDLIKEHITLVFPVTADQISEEVLTAHIQGITGTWKSFAIHLTGFEKSWDHWLFLVVKEGNEVLIQLHDMLYRDCLAPFLRKDIPFVPHIGLGAFIKGTYDLKDPQALTLDEPHYQQALAEAEQLGLDYWCQVDQLTLVGVNESFTQSWNIKDFILS